MITFENCTSSVESAMEAQVGGAIRVELCDNLTQGGTTPALSTILLARKYLDIDLNVLIRPRSGDFCYSHIEVECMKLDIQHCAEVGANGVVVGCLNPLAEVDMQLNSELIALAKSYNMSVTFHRAFDRTPDLYHSLEQVIELGCDRILTSGGENTALLGKETIRKLIRQADDRIIIMPGTGITQDNIEELVNHTGLKEFHGTFGKSVKGYMLDTDHSNGLGSIESEFYTLRTDRNAIKKAIANANKKQWRKSVV